MMLAEKLTTNHHGCSFHIQQIFSLIIKCSRCLLPSRTIFLIPGSQKTVAARVVAFIIQFDVSFPVEPSEGDWYSASPVLFLSAAIKRQRPILRPTLSCVSNCKLSYWGLLSAVGDKSVPLSSFFYFIGLRKVTSPSPAVFTHKNK